MRHGYALLLVICSFSAAHAQPDNRPPLRAGRVAAEIGAGFLGGYAGLLVALPVQSAGDGAYTIAAAVTYPLATAAATYLVGTLGDETGSFWATFAGSTIGTLALFGGVEAAGAVGGERAMWAVAIPGLLLAPAGATIGFNRTRRYAEYANPNGALLDIDSGGLSVGPPATSMRASPIDGSTRRDIAVVRMRF